MTTTTGPALEELHDLIEVLTLLAAMPPVERAARAGTLDRPARAVLMRVADEATFEAVHELVGPDLHRRSHAEVAEALGVRPDRVNQRVVNHRRWLREHSS